MAVYEVPIEMNIVNKPIIAQKTRNILSDKLTRACQRGRKNSFSKRVEYSLPSGTETKMEQKPKNRATRTLVSSGRLYWLSTPK